MTFAYSALMDAAGNQTWRPFLTVRLLGPTGGLTLDMLVDSGADETQIPRSILDDLGVVPSAEEVEHSGVGGARVLGRVCSVKLAFKDQSYVSRSIAAPDEQFALLGQRDFFAHYWGAFDQPRREFRVSPHRTR